MNVAFETAKFGSRLGVMDPLDRNRVDTFDFDGTLVGETYWVGPSFRSVLLRESDL